ncbi:MAG: hypothetical protein ACJAYB_000025 [Psychromonas sp.]|jgi:hypothetical protein
MNATRKLTKQVKIFDRVHAMAKEIVDYQMEGNVSPSTIQGVINQAVIDAHDRMKKKEKKQ